MCQKSGWTIKKIASYPLYKYIIMRTFAKYTIVGVNKKNYIAPKVCAVCFKCERGYAVSNCDYTLQLTPPDESSDNTASSYEQETWSW